MTDNEWALNSLGFEGLIPSVISFPSPQHWLHQGSQILQGNIIWANHGNSLICSWAIVQMEQTSCRFAIALGTLPPEPNLWSCHYISASSCFKSLFMTIATYWSINDQIKVITATAFLFILHCQECSNLYLRLSGVHNGTVVTQLLRIYCPIRYCFKWSCYCQHFSANWKWNMGWVAVRTFRLG